MIIKMNDALAARRRSLQNDTDPQRKERGFTLVELLVVVLIIGILAAIAIPMFLSQRQGAWEGQVKSDLANAAIAAETYALKHEGSYADLTLTKLTENGYRASSTVVLVPTPSAAVGSTVPVGASYTLKATHTKYTGITWTFDPATGLITVT